MIRASLSYRLLLAAALSIVLAVSATGVAIGFLFQWYIEGQIRAELEYELDLLTARIQSVQDGKITVSAMPDVRYREPLSGLYWQVQQPENPAIVSRSLWDQYLPEVPIANPGKIVSRSFDFDDSKIIVTSWIVQLDGVGEEKLNVRLSVARDLASFNESANKFYLNMTLWLSVLAVALTGASWMQVRVGLWPLESIRAELKKLRTSKSARLPDTFPSEVLPLIGEVNSMLDWQKQSLAKARKSAGNLAHGLKTPLTIMNALAYEAKSVGIPELAEDILEQISDMKVIIEHELARSRSDSGGHAWTTVEPNAMKMVSAMKKMPRGSDIQWESNIDSGMIMPFDEHDFCELIGNLLDNARKHAVSKVVITGVQTADNRSVLTVEDDGPGIPENAYEQSTKRGTKLSDEIVGHGLGLSIVKDLADSHDCEIKLGRADSGGLSISISC